VVIKTSVLQGIPNVKADKDKLLRVLKELVFSISSGVEEGIIEIGAGQVNKSSEIVFIISYSEEDFSSSKLELLNAVLATDYGLNDDENSSSIGLSAANDLISGMNGHIKVNRQKGNKNSISIYLPVAKESKEPDEIKQQAAELVTGGDSEIDIFLVEDDRMNRMVIETMLKHTGKVTTAVDGEETLQIIEEYHKSGKVFDIMLFDINLPPPWDGVILMQKIREDYPEYRDIPFVAQTAYAMDSDRDRFLNAGFDDYLTKPINKSELITIIHHQLELFKNRNKK
jgi:CheY-like chemotaxis protein